MENINPMYKILKNSYLSLYKNLYDICYQLGIRVRKLNKNKAVFVLSRTKTLQGNMKFIFLELQRQLPNIEIHFIHAENKMNLKLFKELSVISNAKYLILDDYYLPVYLIKPSKQLKIIQLWHAAGAFKKFGYSTVGTKFGPSKSYLEKIPIHSNYTHVYASSRNIVPFYAEAFNMSTDKIHGFGIPRTEMFFDKEYKNKVIQKLKSEYPILRDSKKVFILIAPTYRAVGKYGESNFNFLASLKTMLSELAEEILVIFKPHPYIDSDELSGYPNVLVADRYFINKWMLISDAFVTDYSSAIFDYSLLKRPFAHFVPDLSYYKKNRGFYSELNKISVGELIKKESEMIKWMNNRKKYEHFDTSRMIEYNFDNTKDVAKKIVKHFINH